MSSAADSDALRAAAAAAGQAHIFDDWDKLSASDRERLLSDVSQLDFGFVRRVFECSIAAPAPGAQQLEPAAGVMQRRDATEAQRAEWTASGYKLIAEVRGKGVSYAVRLPKPSTFGMQALLQGPCLINTLWMSHMVSSQAAVSRVQPHSLSMHLRQSRWPRKHSARKSACVTNWLISFKSSCANITSKILIPRKVRSVARFGVA